MAETGDATCLPSGLALLASDVHTKIEFHRSALHEYISINNAVHKVMEENGKLQQEQNQILQLVAAKDELTKKTEEQAAEIESLKEKLQACESSNTQELQGTTSLQRNQPGQKRQRPLEGHDADGHERMVNLSGMNNHEDGLSTELEGARKEISNIHSKLIKGFIDINSHGGRNIAVKYMGQLSDRPFRQACLRKLPRKEAEAKATELYLCWQKQLVNPEWNPFETITVGGIPEDTLNVHDDMLLDLKVTWGEDVYNAVVNSFMEMKECGSLSDRTIVPEVWNFKENRKVTLSESVEYIFSQVKNPTRRLVGVCTGKSDFAGRGVVVQEHEDALKTIGLTFGGIG